MALGDDPRLTPFVYLARAYERTGDHAAARAAYEELVARFGAMQPASVSVAEARRQMAKLRLRPAK